MHFIQETGYTVKAGLTPELQQWVAARGKRFAASYPAGTSLMGIYITVFTSEKNAGEVRLFEELDSYAALDRLAAAAKDPECALGELMQEFYSFMDASPAAGWSAVLLKDIVEAVGWHSVAGPSAELKEPLGSGA